MWVRHAGYQDLEDQSVFTLVWNLALEARPMHVNERHGANQGQRVCMVEFPPASKDASSSAASCPAKREDPAKPGPEPPADDQEKDCRRCAFGHGSLETTCTCSRNVKCSNQTEVEHEEGAWRRRRNVAYLAKRYNECLEVGWICQFLDQKGLEVIQPHKEDRQKVYVNETSQKNGTRDRTTKAMADIYIYIYIFFFPPTTTAKGAGSWLGGRIGNIGKDISSN